MKKLVTLVALAALTVGVAQAAEHQKVYNGVDPVETNLIMNQSDGGCNPVIINSDETYENGGAWIYGGVVAPTYGAWAECFSGSCDLCELVYDFTSIPGAQAGQSLDGYVWDDAGGEPGNVLLADFGNVPGPIAFFPSFSRHSFAISGAVGGNFWVGYWPNWPGQFLGWFTSFDQNGFQGCPRTNIAPGIGYPTGWQDVNIVGTFSGTQSLGIGYSCGGNPVATEKTTWGAIKDLYNN